MNIHTGVATLILATAAWAHAATTDISNTPLSQSTVAAVPPNVLFIIDDSGSMSWDYMPDYADNSYCRDDDGGGGNLDNCKVGDPPYYANAFNGVYYNPAITYTPPKNADGTSKTSYTTWTAVPKDAYGVQSSSNTNLTTGYQDTVWCDTDNPDQSEIDNAGPATATCREPLNSSGEYVYPDGTYVYRKARYGGPVYYTTTVQWCKNKWGSGTYKNFGKNTCQDKKTGTYKYVQYAEGGTEQKFTRVEVTSATSSYAAAGTATRTYSEEMTNFANWYAYYRTRMQMMKTAVSLAFVDLDDSYRVGYSTIGDKGATDGSEFLTISGFDATQKTAWFSKLFATDPTGWTPLRGALAKAGKIYAGGLGTDPVIASCQQNFAILSTDGYWNSNDENATFGPYKPDGGSVGNQDGSATRPSLDGLNKSDTLADIAYYYYHTDLRPTMDDNVPKIGTNDATDDVATHQHMTTFGLGLGVDGTLNFVDDYKTNTSSTANDYYNILQGTMNWPDPITYSGDQRIDDLWHASVNGRGQYFSARDPASLASGLQQALAKIKAVTGSGAAAATSNLEPVAGDNFIYVASYRTQKWDGDLSAYTIDLGNGQLSVSPSWQVSSTLSAKINSAGNSDTRTIYTYDSSGTAAANKLKAFTWANLTATEQGYFDTTNLSQYASTWSAADKTAATGESLVNYLRGQDRNEDQTRDGSYGAYNRLYRDREYTLGDLISSQPVYVAKPPFGYLDTGYSTYVTSKTSRAATVYVAANDGMLHAFNASDGSERWAYIPPQMLPEMYHLADVNYPDNHRFYVDGAPAVADVYDGSNWRTILVGGFNKGGRGYYALDITDPAAPKALWNYTSSSDNDMGYSFGRPIVTKVGTTWAAVLSSGYNNVTPGDGEGHVWVLNAVTGALIRKIDIGTGSTITPSGLAHLVNWVDSSNLDNSTTYVYGGDLNGDVWKADVTTGAVTKVAALGSDEPVTTRIELGKIYGNRVLFFGTGRYLGTTDVASTDQQYIYGFKEVLNNPNNPRSSLVEQTLSALSTSSRTTTSNSVDWAVKDGWYISLPDTGERVNVNGILQLGTFVIASNVPTASQCSPGGYSWLYALDARYGTFVSSSPLQTSGTRYNNLTVGLSVVKLPGGGVIVYRTGHNDPVPDAFDAPVAVSGAGGIRVNWRELFL